MAIGEAGSISANSPTENTQITVTLTAPLDSPVFALSATGIGPDPFVLRVISQSLDSEGKTTSFTFIMEEWDYLDGDHPTVETINWLAIEEGVHTLPDGRTIEAGTSSVSSTTHNTGTTASFAAAFSAPPVVLTSVMSMNGADTIDSDPSNITATGFDLTLQEQDQKSGEHPAETIGWIAIDAGGDGTSGTANTHTGVDENVDILGLGATFTNSVVLAETQTLNGGETATVVIDSQSNSDVGVFLEEEQSANNELDHRNETVGIVAFEQGVIPCFTRGTMIATPLGCANIEDLNVGDLVDTVDNGPQPIRWIGRRRIGGAELKSNPNLVPIRITAHALGQHLPKRDLLVSRQHRVIVSSKIAKRMFGESDVLVAAIKLTDMPGVFIARDVEEVEYFHLLFDEHELVLAEGAQSESLYLGTETKKALSPAALTEIAAIFPQVWASAERKTIRPAPSLQRQKRLVQRHVRNEKTALM